MTEEPKPVAPIANDKPPNRKTKNWVKLAESHPVITLVLAASASLAFGWTWCERALAAPAQRESAKAEAHEKEAGDHAREVQVTFDQYRSIHATCDVDKATAAQRVSALESEVRVHEATIKQLTLHAEAADRRADGAQREIDRKETRLVQLEQNASALATQLNECNTLVARLRREAGQAHTAPPPRFQIQDITVQVSGVELLSTAVSHWGDGAGIDIRGSFVIRSGGQEGQPGNMSVRLDPELHSGQHMPASGSLRLNSLDAVPTSFRVSSVSGSVKPTNNNESPPDWSVDATACQGRDSSGEWELNEAELRAAIRDGQTTARVNLGERSLCFRGTAQHGSQTTCEYRVMFRAVVSVSLVE